MSRFLLLFDSGTIAIYTFTIARKKIQLLPAKKQENQVVDLLRVNGLEVHYNAPNITIHALNGISFTIAEGENIGVMGETSSGKSTLANAIMNNLSKPAAIVASGKIYYRGQDVFSMPKNDFQKIRDKNLALAAPDLDGSMDPKQPLSKHIIERIAPALGIKKEEALDKAITFFQRIGIQDASVHMEDNLENLSIGTRQLVLLALALFSKPDLLILDNILSGLDAIHQSHVIEMIKEMQTKSSMATLTISHDPGMIAKIADRVIILSGGLIVEEGPVNSVFTSSKHPMTLDLLGNTRRYNHKIQTLFPAASGFSPMRLKKPDHCPYDQRCQFAYDRCKKENPVLIKVGVDHQVACWMDVMNGKAR